MAGARRATVIAKKVWKNGGLGVETKTMLYEGIVVPTALYMAEKWDLTEAEKK